MTRDSWPFPKSMPDKVPQNFPQLPVSRNIADSIAEDFGVRFIHLYRPGRRGGCTLAYAPTVNTKNCKTLEIAVAYVHPKDNYCKKTGVRLAAERWLEGATVIMPLRGKNVHETNHNLWHTFYFSVYSL